MAKKRVRTILTVAGVKAARDQARKTGKVGWIADGAVPRSHGGLQLYTHPKGAPRWYWRYTRPDGSKVRIALGLFAVENPGKRPDVFTLTEAREEVARKAALYQVPETRDVRAHLDREKRRVAAAELAAEKARLAALAIEAEAGKHTLEKLLAVYTAHLEKQGKSSAGAVKNCVLNHVTKAAPSIANMPANVVTEDDIVALLRPLTEAGHGRQAAKLRAYLHAAYEVAMRAKLDANVPAAFLSFRIKYNPVAATGTLSEFNKALDRALTEPELREYYQALKEADDSPIRDALLLALLLGGQRCAQIVRATVGDVDVTAKTLRLLDPKGKRTQARVHLLPLTDEALVVVNRCLDRAKKQDSTWLFSTRGKSSLSPETVTNEATAIATALLNKSKAKRVIKEEFRLRDIRRTCETRLAALGVSRDLRAQIQSHGLGGVQAKHYDRHDYMDEKRAALVAWCAHLETKPADNVRQLHGGRRRVSRR
jgi:site-specific recombinase XerD